MRHFDEYADRATEFASPFVKRTGDFFGSAADSAREWYYAGKKRHEKKCRAAKMKEIWDNGLNIVALIIGIAAAAAAVLTVVRFIVGRVCCANHKIAAYDEAAVQIDDVEPEAASAEEKPKKKSEKAKNKNSGYITL